MNAARNVVVWRKLPTLVLVHRFFQDVLERADGTEARMKTTRWISGAGLLFGLMGVASAQGPLAGVKVRAPFVPNAWRTVTPVPSTWSLDDCRNMGSMIGAAVFQVASFETEQPGQISKFILVDRRRSKVRRLPQTYPARTTVGRGPLLPDE
jgi:hypothetical protein